MLRIAELLQVRKRHNMNTLLGLPLVRENRTNSSLASEKSSGSLLIEHSAATLGIFLLTVLLGCEPSPVEKVVLTNEPPQEAEKSLPSEAAESKDVSPLPPGAKLLDSQQTWHANYLQGKKIGYRDTLVRKFELGAKRFTQTEIVERQSLLRFGEKVTLEVKASQLADEKGAIVQFRYELPLGNEVTRVQGKVEAGKLTYWTENQPDKAPEQVPFPADTLGFSGLEDSLADKPMKPGEERTIKMLQLPPLPLVGTVTLQAKEEELTALPAGEVRLLRIDEKLELPGGGSILCHFWTDSKGQILKYSVPPVQQETYLVTREQALDNREAFSVDLGSDMLVRLEKPLDKPHEKLRIVYRIQVKPGPSDINLEKLLASGNSQELKLIDDSTALVTVWAVQLGLRAKIIGAQVMPTDADRKPSNLIESDNAEIKTLAQEVLKQPGFDPGTGWTVARMVEKFVHDYLTQKNYSQAFSSAAEVARTREGDCTEHAVLVAALCRALGIPARVAYGLVYVESEQAFAFHMWDEVWAVNRWVPFDATLAQGGIGAGHIKFGHSSLSDMSALLELLPVMQSLGRLEIEVESMEDRPE